MKTFKIVGFLTILAFAPGFSSAAFANDTGANVGKQGGQDARDQGDGRTKGDKKGN